jgi:hypothetical protein
LQKASHIVPVPTRGKVRAAPFNCQKFLAEALHVSLLFFHPLEVFRLLEKKAWNVYFLHNFFRLKINK